MKSSVKLVMYSETQHDCCAVGPSSLCRGDNGAGAMKTNIGENVYVNSCKRFDRLHACKERADQAILEEYMELVTHERKTQHDDEWQAPRAWADDTTSSFLLSKPA